MNIYISIYTYEEAGEGVAALPLSVSTTARVTCWLRVEG
jgi:hypothetical protein